MIFQSGMRSIQYFLVLDKLGTISEKCHTFIGKRGPSLMNVTVLMESKKAGKKSLKITCPTFDGTQYICHSIEGNYVTL